MKKTILTLAISMILFAMITSCKKDESTSINTTTTKKDTLYYVQYDGKKYQIDNAHIFYTTSFAGVGGCYFYTAYFVSKGVTYDSFFNQIDGVGNGLKIALSAGSPSSYSGTYNTDTLDNTAEVGEITYANFYMNSDFGMDITGGVMKWLKSGSCTITKVTTDTVLVTGDFISSENKIAKLYFKGVMPRHEIDYK